MLLMFLVCPFRYCLFVVIQVVADSLQPTFIHTNTYVYKPKMIKSAYKSKICDEIIKIGFVHYSAFYICGGRVIVAVAHFFVLLFFCTN